MNSRPSITLGWVGGTGGYLQLLDHWQSDDDVLTITMALEDIRDLKDKLDEAAEALSKATQNGSEP